MISAPVGLNITQLLRIKQQAAIQKGNPALAMGALVTTQQVTETVIQQGKRKILMANGYEFEVPVNPVPLKEDRMDAKTDVEVPGSAPMPGSSVHDHEGWRAQLAHICQTMVADPKSDPMEVKKALMSVVAMLDAPEKEEPMPDDEYTDDSEPAMDESIKALKDSTDPTEKTLYESVVAALKEQRKTDWTLDRLKAKQAVEGKRELATTLYKASQLPKFNRPLTEGLMEELIEAGDEKHMKWILEDKANIASIKQPRSLPSAAIGGGVKGDKKIDNKEFANSLMGIR